MKKVRLIVSFLVVLLIISGCMSEIKTQKISIQKRAGEEELIEDYKGISVQKRTSEEGIFEDYKEVTLSKQVRKAIEIVKEANWEKAKVEMDCYADYQFQFPFKNSSEDKIASYLLWVSPNGENLEIVTASDRYVKLTKQDSADLYEILTGEALSVE